MENPGQLSVEINTHPDIQPISSAPSLISGGGCSFHSIRKVQKSVLTSAAARGTCRFSSMAPTMSPWLTAFSAPECLNLLPANCCAD